MDLLVDERSIRGSVRERVGDQSKVADLLLLRLVFTLKMMYHPDNIIVLADPDYMSPFNNVHFTDTPLLTLKALNYTYFGDTIIFSADPEFLGLSKYAKLTYRPASNFMVPEAITFNKLKKELGYDPRGTSYHPDSGDNGDILSDRQRKTRVGQWIKREWAWILSEDSGDQQVSTLRSIADNVHIKVGRTGFQNYEIVQDLSHLLRLLDHTDDLGWDTETTGLDWTTDQVVGESFSFDGQHGYYLPIMHPETGRLHNIPRGQVEEQLHPILREKKLRGANLAFDVLMCAQHGLGFPKLLYDIQGYGWMLGMHLPDPSALGLKTMTKNILGEVMEEYAEVSEGKATFAEVPIERAAPYAADDAVKSYQLIDALRSRMDSDQLARYENIERLFLYTCIRMSYNGMYIDTDAVSPILHNFQEEMALLESHIRNYNDGEPILLSSSQQLQKFLFGKLGLPPVRRTKTGYSTDDATLETLVSYHPAAGMLRRHRELNKLVTGYLVPLPTLVKSDDRIHSSFNPFRIITGRVASTKPNVTNIPRRTEDGRRLRTLFTGQHDNLLMSTDAGQLEYRILAHYIKSSRLIEAFSDPTRDVHREMASIVFEKPLDAVSYEDRDTAKTVVYAIIYGASERKVAETAEVSIPEGARILQRIAKNFPEIQVLREQVLYTAQELGYVPSLLGHRTYVWGLKSRDKGTREHAERAAFDGLFQGTGSGDVTKIASIITQQKLDELYPDLLNPTVRFIDQIHDEILLEGPQYDLEYLKPFVELAFTKHVKMDVPLTAEGHIGKRWSDVH